ncbi:MAG TPA: trans-aconitate 2-methyltransferase [Candidatus Angelobacter sp.]|nr:trans-aconitate 2-methyltransferase [Candidatus Angelobacter sp.]
MPAWDPNLYLKYADERGRPASDLIAQIHLEAPARIVDLGCGPGNSTALLRQRWPHADLTGVDNSPEMMAQARKKHPDWHWVLGDIESWKPEHEVNLIFSNAALHWVPGHATLFRSLINGVAPGGALAAQMPNNFHSAAHSVMQEVAAGGDPRWSKALATAAGTFAVQPAPFYYDVLRKNASRVDIWETEYQHVMDGPKAVFDWIRSTGMRPYLDRLADDEQRRLFEEMCLEGIQEAYRPNDQGKVLFPFRRMFIVAYR